MRVAWLRAGAVPTAPDPLDDTASLIAGLRAEHDIETIDARSAHDLVWRQARQPFDLFVHELADSSAHAFIAAYAVHFSGVLMLRGFAPHHPRAIAASRTVVVGDTALAASLQEKYPAIPIVTAPVGVAPVGGAPTGRGSDAVERATQPVEPGRRRGVTRFGLLDGSRRHLVERAGARARDAGERLDIVTGPAATVLRDADVIVVLDWPPPAGPPVGALAGMAAAKPVIVLETLVTAGWPALDPQTWQPRGYERARGQGGQGATAPVAVSIDPRDEEHSLMLAMKRLSAEPALRASLAAAGYAWWITQATIPLALAAWRRILNEPGLPPRPAFAGADGSEHARGVLAAFGVQVDFL